MSTEQMAGKPKSQSIADDVISAQPQEAISDLGKVRSELDDIVSRIDTLEIMVMRILDAMELSHDMTRFGEKVDYRGPC